MLYMIMTMRVLLDMLYLFTEEEEVRHPVTVIKYPTTEPQVRESEVHKMTIETIPPEFIRPLKPYMEVTPGETARYLHWQLHASPIQDLGLSCTHLLPF